MRKKPIKNQEPLEPFNDIQIRDNTLHIGHIPPGYITLGLRRVAGSKKFQARLFFDSSKRRRIGELDLDRRKAQALRDHLDYLIPHLK